MDDLDAGTGRSSAAHALTEREAALFHRARLEVLDDLVADLERREPSGDLADETDSAWSEGYGAGLRTLRAVRDRFVRLVPPPAELPPAPCAASTVYGEEPILCGFPAGHEITGVPEFLHAWQYLVPNPVSALDQAEEDHVDEIAELLADIGATVIGRLARTASRSALEAGIRRIRHR